MTELFGIDVAALIGDALDGQLKTGTLHVAAQGARTPGSLTSGNHSGETDHIFEGFQELRTDRQRQGSTATTSGRWVSIVGASLPSGVKPTAGDGITIEGIRYQVLEVEVDPADALYECRVEA